MRPNKDNDGNAPHVAAQVASAWADFEAATRDARLQETLLNQDRAYLDALKEMQTVRDFVGSPQHILGSPATKHGEIAEQVHVGVRRAMDILHHRTPGATFEGIGRTSAVDYRADGVDVQSKYINGIRNTLDHVNAHAKTYPEFSQGSAHYHIPRDQFEKLQELQAAGEIEGYSLRSAATLERKLHELENITGRSAEDLLKAGEATYEEVQQGKIHETLRAREDRLATKNEELKEVARADHGPTLQGFSTAAAVGAGAGAGVRVGQALWVKYKQGKNPFTGDFDLHDWKEVGLEAGKGATGGAVAGGALYMLTNSTDLAAPFAGALVSGLMGVGSLLKQYDKGEIDAEEFAELAHFVAIDAAIIGLASAAGQAIIPIPILGAVVGSLAGKIVTSALRESFSDAEAALIARLQEYETRALNQLDAEFQALMERLDAYFGNLEALTELAFDQNTNVVLRLQTSVQFAEAVGVPDDEIIRSIDDLDSFMME